jgi:hypothetical protein
MSICQISYNTIFSVFACCTLLQVYLTLDAAAEREVGKMAGALAGLRAAAAAADSGFAQGQLVNEMYRRTAELKARCFLLLCCLFPASRLLPAYTCCAQGTRHRR